jgi:NAD+ synthase (glutamine-hydrolysing)
VEPEMNKFGHVRVAACSPVVEVGNPKKNIANICAMFNSLIPSDTDIVVFPELCITGYTCADLFSQRHLLKSCFEQLNDLKGIRQYTYGRLVFIGMPIAVGNQLFNCAVAMNNGQVIGVIPKQNIPNYNEFQESRWFQAANGQEPKTIDLPLDQRIAAVPFGTDLLFQFKNMEDEEDLVVVGAEICEDLWMPIPPSSYQCLGGANILVNLSASNETVAKNEYRTKLVENQSGRCIAGYVYASSGPTESTNDLVFGGHCIIAENGHVMEEVRAVGEMDEPPVNLSSEVCFTEIDIQKLQSDRRKLSSFRDASGSNVRSYRYIPFSCGTELKTLRRRINGTPFVPIDPKTLKKRCSEVIGIQCSGLAVKLRSLMRSGNHSLHAYIGVSGGLDSTLALLVTVETYKALKLDVKLIHGLTLPGYGTTDLTLKNAIDLMTLLGITQDEIHIPAICAEAYKAIQHKPFGIEEFMDHTRFMNKLDQLTPDERKAGDLVFENIQARVRTMLLLTSGFTVGTGDLSEAALGWCTFNGDHISNYNVNCSVPKTLVKFLVKHVADNLVEGPLSRCLLSIVGTTISPELLPKAKDGTIEQSTEDKLGPYELHDFYLPCFVRDGFSPEKILYLSDFARFTREYSRELRIKTLRTFISRFFSQQFKRNCVPEGPKVGSVSLSPRGDWRMPSDANPELWLENIQ